MKRIVALVAVIATGCYSVHHRKLAYTADGMVAGGIALEVLGVATLPKPPPGEGGCLESPAPGSGAPCALAAIGLLTVAVGLVLEIVTLGANVVDLADPPKEAARAPTPPPPTAPPTPVAIVLPPLPSLATDPATLSLARQARVAAVHHECTAARVILDRISDRDPAYRDALAAMPIFDACR